MVDTHRLFTLAAVGGLAWLAWSQTSKASTSTTGGGCTPTAAELANLKATANQIAQGIGLDPALFRALIQAESAWKPCALSSSGAIGLTQLMPLTAAALLVNPLDVRSNLIGGARYLHTQIATFGNIDMALSAYNAGPGNVSKAIAYSTAHGVTWQQAMRQFQSAANFAQTQNYVNRVKSYIGKV